MWAIQGPKSAAWPLSPFTLIIPSTDANESRWSKTVERLELNGCRI